MTSDVHALRAGPLTEERWAPFGWLPVRDTDPRDGQPAWSSPGTTCT